MTWRITFCLDTVVTATDVEKNEFLVYYFIYLRPFYRDIYIDDSTEYNVDIIDTWNMTIKPQGTYRGEFSVILGGKPYMVIRMRKNGGIVWG